ncbi:MAG: amino acid ABC transporter substrate-binding protein [Proteobacteria bacterium]|nr:amino acid ABC transporter substrate-binding protein [Pseudomonadota bacterium]
MNSKQGIGRNTYVLITFVIVAVVTLVLRLSPISETGPIKLGFVGNLTGTFSDWGIAGRDGLLLGIEEANEAGGINGRKIEVLVRDDRQDPERAARMVKELADEGVVAVVGPTISSTALKAAPVSYSRQMLLIATTATTTRLSGVDDFFLRVTSPADHLTIGLAEYLYEKEGWRKVVATYCTKNRAYCADAYKIFKNRFEELGGLVDLAPLPASEGDYAKIARHVAKVSPDGFYMVGSVTETAAISQRIRKTGVKVGLACQGAGRLDELLQHGGASVEGLVTVKHFFDDARDDRFNEFKELCNERFGGKSGYPISFGYSAATMITEALRKSDRMTPVELKSTILRIRKFKSPIGDYTIDKYGDSSRPVYALKVKNGRFVEVHKKDIQ